MNPVDTSEKTTPQFGGGLNFFQRSAHSLGPVLGGPASPSLAAASFTGTNVDVGVLATPAAGGPFRGLPLLVVVDKLLLSGGSADSFLLVSFLWSRRRGDEKVEAAERAGESQGRV